MVSKNVYKLKKVKIPMYISRIIIKCLWLLSLGKSCLTPLYFQITVIIIIIIIIIIMIMIMIIIIIIIIIITLFKCRMYLALL